MNILLTNDDGYDAEGIRILRQILKTEHNVYVMAPHKNRSAVSSSITMKGYLEIHRKEDGVWACSGTPVDCVIAALRSGIIEQKIDVVISGINAGANLGTDIIYSGTCAAARQGVLYGIPSIAVSEDKGDRDKYDFRNLANFIKDNLEKLVDLCSAAECVNAGNRLPWNPVCFVNVNGKSVDGYKGVVLCKFHGARNYNDTALVTSDDEENRVIIKGGRLESFGNSQSDCFVVEEGKIALSLVLAEPYCINTVDLSGFSL